MKRLMTPVIGLMLAAGLLAGRAFATTTADVQVQPVALHHRLPSSDGATPFSLFVASPHPASKAAVDRRYAESQNGGSCIGYNRIYPNGSTVACMVQPGPNNLCSGPLGLTVKLWTCRNGQWIMVPQ
jgi:hypothetical protein